MPVNVAYNPDAPHLGGVEQKLFPGTSIEQLDGLVDLLSHYGAYSGQKNDISKLVKEAEGAGGGAEQPAASEEEEGEQANNERPGLRAALRSRGRRGQN